MTLEVLDSYAILGWLQKESSAEIVQDRLDQAVEGAIELYFSAINAGEVHYLLAKRRSQQIARVWNERLLPSLPVRIITPNLAGVLKAAELKAQYAISYADSFAASLALTHDAPLLTGDPEFKAIPGLRLHWIGDH